MSICCQWSARLFIITGKDGTWQEGHTENSLIYRGNSIRRFDVEDIDGDGFEEALVEGEFSGAPASDSAVSNWFDLYVFSLREQKPQLIVQVAVLGMLAPTLQFERSLDRGLTKQSHGMKYCFTKKTFAERARALPKPRITKECFDRRRE